MTSSSAPPTAAFEARGGIWGRQLDRYPATGPRAAYLVIVVLATITLYYELYVQGSVATALAANLHMTLVYLISISIVGNAVGACASVVAGLADRWGRANLVVYGLAVTGALVFFGLANATDKLVYLVLFAVVSFVEGMILVATPALVRDFSPQLGRASAMCFWTMGPVLGSLVVSEVASHTLDSHPDWQYQFRVCGIVGLAVFVIAFIGLRELAPQLRDQLMVSLRDKALIEANARGIDPNEVLSGHWRQMLRKDIIGPAIAISLSLLFYYIAVGFFIVFYATNFGYTEARANALSNWYWGANAVALLVTGILSDALRVRKPFMLLGGLTSLVGVALFAIATTHPGTTYYQFVAILMPISIGGALAFASWMAAFTETVEKHNPAATATGLAVWGSTLRSIVVIALLALIAFIPAASTLVDQGTPVSEAVAGQVPGLSASENATVKAIAADPSIATQVQTIAAKDSAQLATAQKLTPTTQAALAATPNDPADAGPGAERDLGPVRGRRRTGDHPQHAGRDAAGHGRGRRPDDGGRPSGESEGHRRGGQGGRRDRGGLPRDGRSGGRRACRRSRPFRRLISACWRRTRSRCRRRPRIWPRSARCRRATSRSSPSTAPDCRTRRSCPNSATSRPTRRRCCRRRSSRPASGSTGGGCASAARPCSCPSSGC